MSDDVVGVIIFFLFIILLVPTFIQIKYGVRALAGWTNMKFWQIAFFFFFFYLILKIVMFFIVAFVTLFFSSVFYFFLCVFGFWFFVISF